MATLDVIGKPDSIKVPDGVDAPRPGDQLKAKDDAYSITHTQTGVVVYVTEKATELFTPKTVNITRRGYYMFNGKKWQFAFGSDDDVEKGELVYYRGIMLANVTGWISSYIMDLPVLGNVLRLDGYFNASSNGGNGLVSFNPRLVNVTNSPVKLWFSAMTTVDKFNAGNYLLAAGGGVCESGQWNLFKQWI